MKLSEVRDLLVIVAGLNGRPFPEGAPAGWFEVLYKTDAEDARKAVIAYYSNKDADGPITPGELRAGAAWFAERRLRAKRELPAAPVVTERSAMAREVIREMTAAAVARHRAENPEARPYRHRRTLLSRVDA